jgi:hypothetical protein
MPTEVKKLPIASARYGKTVVLQFDSANDAKELFQSLCTEAGYDWKRGHYPSLASLDFLRNVADDRFPDGIVRIDTTNKAAADPTGGGKLRLGSKA